MNLNITEFRDDPLLPCNLPEQLAERFRCKERHSIVLERAHGLALADYTSDLADDSRLFLCSSLRVKSRSLPFAG